MISVELLVVFEDNLRFIFYNTENMVFQEGETLSTVSDGKCWRHSDVGVYTYSGLFLDLLQRHV